jgi:hypothetical protein
LTWEGWGGGGRRGWAGGDQHWCSIIEDCVRVCAGWGSVHCHPRPTQPTAMTTTKSEAPTTQCQAGKGEGLRTWQEGTARPSAQPLDPQNFNDEPRPKRVRHHHHWSFGMKRGAYRRHFRHLHQHTGDAPLPQQRQRLHEAVPAAMSTARTHTRAHTGGGGRWCKAASSD